MKKTDKVVQVIVGLVVLIVLLFCVFIKSDESCDCDKCVAEKNHAEWERDNGSFSDGGY